MLDYNIDMNEDRVNLLEKKGNADQSIKAIQFIDGNVTFFKVDEMKKVHE